MTKVLDQVKQETLVDSVCRIVARSQQPHSEPTGGEWFRFTHTGVDDNEEAE